MGRSTVVPGMAFMFLVLCGALPSPDAFAKGDASLDRAVEMARAGDTAGAISLLNEVVRREKDREVLLRAHFMLGGLHGTRLERKDALEHFDAALAMEPRRAEVHYWKGVVLQSMPGRAEEALASFEKSRELGYPDPEIFYRLGGSCKIAAEMGGASPAQREEYLRRAAGYFGESLARNPRHVPSLGNLGDLHFNAGRYREALSVYQRLEKINPESALVHAYLGETLLALEETARALPHLERALRLESAGASPADVTAKLLQLNREIRIHMALGEAYARLDRDKDAKQALDRALKLTDKTVDGYGVANAGELRAEIQERLKRPPP